MGKKKLIFLETNYLGLRSPVMKKPQFY